jgi:hypothetical protein
MNRLVRRILVVLAVIGHLAADRRGRADGPPCTIATHGNSPVVQACADGGLVFARRAMRDLVRRAKAAGTRFECDECHRNDTNYELTPQARESFRKLLAAAGDSRP